MTFLPIAILFINLLSILFGLMLLSNKGLKDHFFRLPLFLQKLYVLFVVVPLFISPLISQNRFNMSGFISLPIGIILLAIGLIIIIFAFLKIGIVPSLRQKSNIITSGIYGIVRHPVYSGTVIAVLGWTILLKSTISILYFPFLFLLYFLITVFEERILIEEYGEEYTNYRKKVTKRLIPFIV